MRRLSILLVLGTLAGCGTDEPVQLTESQARYVGVWQHVYESETATSLDIDNMLLVINPDSTAVFRQCSISKTFSSNSTRSSSRRVTMPDAYVIEISGDEISLEQEADLGFLGSYGISYDVDIERDPYEDNGRIYMVAEETVLQKLEGDEIGTLTGWVCPEDEDDDDF
jgi:hypothetical protein